METVMSELRMAISPLQWTKKLPALSDKKMFLFLS